MSQKISRREFGARAVAGAAGIALLGQAAAQETKKEETPHPDIPQLNKQLAKPVPEDLVKGVSDGLKHNDDLGSTRWKHKLPEGSEPGTVFSAQGAKNR